MKKLAGIVIGLILVLVLVSATGSNGYAFAQPSDLTTTPTEEYVHEVTPTLSTSSGPTATCTPTPTEEVTPTPSEEVTPTPSTSSGPTATPTPNNESGPTPTPVVTVTTMAKTGSFEQNVMNLAGIFGMILLSAGYIIYAKKYKNNSFSL